MSAVTRYRPEISKLSFLDDASPAEKQRFVTYFDLTRKETFTPRLLRVGWNAVRLYLAVKRSRFLTGSGLKTMSFYIIITTRNQYYFYHLEKLSVHRSSYHDNSQKTGE
jgi:hypothetical protein